MLTIQLIVLRKRTTIKRRNFIHVSTVGKMEKRKNSFASLRYRLCWNSIAFSYDFINDLSESWVIMPAKHWHCTLKSKYYSQNEKNAWEINITVAMFQIIGYTIRRIMPFVESIFSGWIHRANPMHQDVAASWCYRGGSTTSY